MFEYGRFGLRVHRGGGFIQHQDSSEHVNQEMLLFRLSATSSPLHKQAHMEMIKRLIAGKANLHHYRYISKMLRNYSRHDVIHLLLETTDLNDDRSIWLVREVENVRRQRLINEALQWIV